ncbi:MAG: radical SAM protein [Myxococcales bacterium]|nr:radical SAM protein [Myxococcota bacterium]MDW8284068.1 radical SAM protein [Myxococcales bacterium]
MAWPAYRSLDRAELYRRIDEAVAGLGACRVCPRDCEVNRLADETAVCRAGRRARVSAYFPHFGEEDCLRGYAGSGTIFFGWCNLRCVFCQNWETSQQGAGQEVGPRELAAMMLELQARGCHNINWVTPEHVVPQILESLPYAIEGGLHLPIVYNTSAYDSLHSLHLMEGIVDIYMPDFKYWDPHLAARYLKAKDYPEVARRAVREMHRQVGPLVLDEEGLARRGLLVRHLVMPGATADAEAIFRFLATELGPDTYVNIMDQYRPEGSVLRMPHRYPELCRPTTSADHEAAVAAARRAGLHRIDVRRPHPRARWALWSL